MNCPKCNTQNEESAKFCIDCGTSLFLMKACPKCNYQGGEESHFCKNCGAKLIEEFIKSPKPSKVKKSKKLILSIIAIGIVLVAVVAGYFILKDMRDTNEKVDVYVAGYVYTQGKYIAVLWKNGVPQKLTYETKSTIANSVYVSDNDVYVVGHTLNEKGKDIAIVWKNGVPQDLPDGNRVSNVYRGIKGWSQEERGAVANSVFVSDNDVYVVGTYTWKNGNILYENGGKSIFVSENDVYVVGNENPYSNQIAKVYKNGIAQNLGQGWTTSVFVSENDVYVAGGNINGGILWKNGVAQKLTDGKFWGQEGTSVFVSDNNVYVVGMGGHSDFPGRNDALDILWKNGKGHFLGDEANSYILNANSIFVYGNDVYVTGNIGNSGDGAVLWKNGVVQPLTDETKSAATANSVFVVKKNN